MELSLPGDQARLAAAEDREHDPRCRGRREHDREEHDTD
jgi:hypothetical protein